MLTQAFAEALAEAEKLIAAAPFVASEQDLAEGYEYLAGSIQASLRLAWAYQRDFPYFVMSTGPYTKMGLDNPDTLYFHAYLRDDAEYVVTGRRGSTADLSFQVLKGDYSPVEVPDSLSAFDDRAIEVDADGAFELRFAGVSPGGQARVHLRVERVQHVRAVERHERHRGAHDHGDERLGDREIAEAAPEDEMLRRRNRRDRVELEEPESSHRLEDARRRAVERLAELHDATLDRRGLGGDGGTTFVERRDLFAIEDNLLLALNVDHSVRGTLFWRGSPQETARIDGILDQLLYRAGRPLHDDGLERGHEPSHIIIRPCCYFSAR